MKKNDFYPLFEEWIGRNPLMESSRDIALKPISTRGVITAPDGTQVDMTYVTNEIEAAKIAIIGQAPLFSPLVHELNTVYTWLVPTMATDGVRLLINPQFADILTWEQKIFVLIHEIMHCVLLHMERMKGKNPEKFNYAADFEINAILVDTIDKFTEQTVRDIKGLYDVQYLNLPVETIYKMIPDPPSSPGQKGQPGEGEGQEGEGQPGEGEGQPGEGKPGEGKPGEGKPGEGKPGEGKPGEDKPESGTGSTESEREFRERMEKRYKDTDPGGTGSIISPEEGKMIAEKSGVEAGDHSEDSIKEKWSQKGRKMLSDLEARGAGKGKGGALMTALSKMHRGEVNWKSQFAKYVSDALAKDWEEKLGDKRHLGKEYYRYYSRPKQDALDHVICLIDISGSMPRDVLEKILDELNGIIFSKKVKKITVAFFDDGVDEKSVQTITYGNRPYIPKDVSGGGGTDFQAALDWVKWKYKDRVSLLVFFTDTGAPMPTKPKYHRKFIWIVYENLSFVPPFGKMINLSNSGDY